METPTGSEVTTEGEVEGEGEEGAKRSSIIPLLIVGLIGLGGGGALGGRILGPWVGEQLAQRQVEGGSESHGGGHGGEEASSVHVVDNLVVNPADSEGTRFLLTSVAIQVFSPDDAGPLSARDVELRDALIMILGGKTVEELTDITLRKGHVDEIFRSLEVIIGPEVIRRVFIPQFVIQ